MNFKPSSHKGYQLCLFLNGLSFLANLNARWFCIFEGPGLEDLYLLKKPTQIRFFTLIGPEQGHLPHAFQLAPLGSLLQLDGQVSVLLDSYFLPFFPSVCE